MSHTSRGGPSRTSRTLHVTMLALALLTAGRAGVASAASTPMVDLRTASTYAVMSGASVGNTVSAAGAPHTTLRGNLGVKAAAQPSGFPPGVVTGSIEAGTAAAIQAHADLVAAYVAVAGRTGGTALAGALTGATVGPGLHTITGAVSNTGTVTLDAGGDPNAVFVFQVGGALAVAAGSRVTLTGGAQASRVFWQVNGAGAIGANAGFAGTLMALDAVTVGNGSVVNGRAFARNGALSLDANEIYGSPPSVTLTGGATTTTTDTTPTLGGLTSIEAPGVVTVTINGQTLAATPSAGAWATTSAILANGTYAVTASVVDGADNAGSTTQLLTVDTVPPSVSIDGGAATTTNDPSPTFFGASDVAPGTVVRLSIGALERTALVQADGTWNTTPAALVDGIHTVTASVTDPAGNVSAANQAVTVDTVAPAATVVGGASALTRDATPDISGTAAVTAGTTVTVETADETLVGIVTVDGTWTVTVGALADGPHRVTVQVADAATNVANVTQLLTVDTVSPGVTIDGGPVATTANERPTIHGTSTAAPGTTVTVSIGGQVMTTLLQSNGTWNATPTLVGAGSWLVIASAPDPAANVGSAVQSLEIAGAVVPASEGGGDAGAGGAVPGGSGAVPAGSVLPPVGGGAAAPIAGPSSPPVRPAPRATTTLTFGVARRVVAARTAVALRGTLRSTAAPTRRGVTIQLWQRVGARWILRRTSRVTTTTAGGFVLVWRAPARGRGSWRARASFAGAPTTGPAASPHATFVAR